MKLSLDSSCILDGVEEGGDGVWSIVGGKVSHLVLYDAWNNLMLVLSI